MVNASPVFDGSRKLYFMPLPIQDGLVSYKSNDNQTMMLIVSGTGRITEELLDNDPLLKDKQYFYTL